MLPKTHIILGLIFSSLVYFVFHITLLETLIIFFASFLIDVDHYLLHLFIKKDFSLKNANKWFLDTGKYFDNLPKQQKNKYHLGYFPLHTLEFLLILYWISLKYNLFLMIMIGFVFHTVCDFIYEIFVGKRAAYKISIIYTYLTREFIGISPQKPNP